jgi:hypothetical protein
LSITEDETDNEFGEENSDEWGLETGYSITRLFLKSESIHFPLKFEKIVRFDHPQIL